MTMAEATGQGEGRMVAAPGDRIPPPVPVVQADYRPAVEPAPACHCGGRLVLERTKWRCSNCGLYPEACCNGSRG